jgi:hypothetical protein
VKVKTMASATRKVAEIPKAKRVAPDMKGVPGELVSAAGLEFLVFGKARVSPYDALLDQLAAAGAGSQDQR